MAVPVKILNRHLTMAIERYSEHIDFVAHQGVSKWMARIRGMDGTRKMDGCLRGAEILIEFDTTVKLGSTKETKDTYPYAPPRFYVHTPNGLYEVGNKVCVDQGEFHSQNYDQTLGIGGFAMYLLSGLSDDDRVGGIRLSRVTDRDAITRLSLASKGINKKNFPDVVRRMDVQYLALIRSGLWRQDPDNPDRLVRTMVGEKHDKQYKTLAKAVAAWSVATDTVKVENMVLRAQEIVAAAGIETEPPAGFQSAAVDIVQRHV